MRNRNGIRAAALLATVLGTSNSIASTATTALTVSGHDAEPYSIRGGFVEADGGIGIRFQAPVTADLATVHLAWRQRGAACTVALRADADGDLGDELASSDLPDDATWVTAALPAHLAAGSDYHLAVRCVGAGRLAYVLDRSSAVADGAWRLEFQHGDDVRPRRPPLAPLFLLTFADGSVWGQPYLPARGRLLVCGPNELATVIVPAESTSVRGIELPRNTLDLGPNGPIQYTLTAADTPAPLLSGVATTSESTSDVAEGDDDAASTAVDLTAGVPYMLHLRAPSLRAACFRMTGLVTGFPHGEPVSGIDTMHVTKSADAGRTWSEKPLATLGARMKVKKKRRPPETTTSTTVTTTSTTDPSTTTTSTTSTTSSTSTTSTTTSTTTSSTTTSSTTTSTTSTTTSSTTTSTTSTSTTSTSTTSSSTTSTSTSTTSTSTTSTTASSTTSTSTTTSSTTTSTTSTSTTSSTDLPPIDTSTTTSTTVTTTSTTITIPTTSTTTTTAPPPTTSTTTTPTTSTAPLPPTTTTTTTSPPPVTTTTDPQAYRSIYAGGFLGFYDKYGQTVTDWPRKLALIEVDATTQNSKIAAYRQASTNAGNHAAGYWFYASLTSIDSRCGCRDQVMYQALSSREDFWLHDSGGRRVSTFVSSLGTGRQIATDVGNPAFVDAWVDYQLKTMQQYGWDGVWTDNIVCAWTSWSGTPMNPRTGAPYTIADYRRDVASALGRIHAKLAAAGKRILGNHGGSCVQDFFQDASVRRQLDNMDGTAIENCVFDFWDSSCGCNRPHTERTFIDQLRYLSYANRNGKQSECILQHGGVDPNHRSYGLASYLLTKEGTSLIGELNGASEYWTAPPGGTHGLDTDLGAPIGYFYCLDPARGFAPLPSGVPGCPGTGMIYGRDFTNGKVLSNPTANGYTVPLEGRYVCDGVSRSSVTLPSKGGVVCNR